MKKYLFAFPILATIIANGQMNKPGTEAMFHANATHDGIHTGNNFNHFGELKWKFKTHGKIFSSPAVANNIGYIGSEDGYLYAVDIAGGREKWKFKTNGAVHSSPTVYNNAVYFGSYDGYYYAVDAATGKEKWKFKTGGEKHVGAKGLWTMQPANLYMEDLYDFFLSSPVVNTNDQEPIVYFGSSDGNLYAVNAATGSLKWKFASSGIIHTSPALYKGMIYFGSWDTYLYALDAKTGKEIWKFKTNDQPNYHLLEGIQASPTIYDGKVYFGARDANFYSLDATTGALVWKYFADNSWILTTAAAKDSVVFIGTSDSYLFLALDARTGKENYRFAAKGYLYSSPVVAGNVAYFGDFTGRLYGVDLRSKGKIWNDFSVEARTKNAKKVLNANDRLDFTYTAAGKDPALYSTGVSVMHALYTLGSILSSPVIDQGVIYFGSADGYLYAIQLIHGNFKCPD